MKKEESGIKNGGKRKEEECSYKGERKIRKKIKGKKEIEEETRRKEEEKRREKINIRMDLKGKMKKGLKKLVLI